MNDPIYFSKVEYRQVIGYGNTLSIMLLNIPEKELSYQVFNWKRQMPGMEGVKAQERHGQIWTDDIATPIKKVKSGKNGFEE